MTRRDALGSWASITLTVALVAITICPLVSGGERWSRQLTEFTGGPLAGSDWIPLSRPGSERQAGARVLNYFTTPQQTFLDPDSAAQAQQHHFTFLNHQFPQSNRFLLQQPTPQQQPAQELLEQPFHLTGFQRTAPFVGQTIQHPPPPLPQPQSASSTNPFEPQFLSKPSDSEAQIQDNKQQPLHLQRQQQPQPSLLDQPFSYQHIRQPELDTHPPGPQSGPSVGAVSQEEVQLLYVPVETLYNQKQSQSAPDNNRFNTLPQPVSPSLINDFYTAGTTTSTPNPPRTSAATFAPRYTTAPDTPAPALSRSSTSTLGAALSKPKPNQPPLALFLYNDGRQGKLSTGDALGGLKNINEIAVLDAFGKNTPKVFIGPSGLAPSKSYSRFDLPYLSSVDLSSNRANRKIEDLPFFVAPLSYKTPSGYSKVALPPPHVGSIIVRQSSSSSGNSLDHTNFYTRPTAPSNVQYYTPSTLNFDDNGTPTKAPITLSASGKPIYDSDHYTSPTGKPILTSSSKDRDVGQLGSFSNPNPLPASRHPSVNEEYFNLAKTKKPTTSPISASTTPSYPFKSYGSTRQFDFKPMPDQKIPQSFYPQEEDDSSTTLLTTTTTTERPTTVQLQFEAERMRTHFREENFRSRRPHHHQPTTPASLSEKKPQEQQQQQQFVHKFKLVDSVRPNNVKSSVVEHGFLDFFNNPSQQYTDEMIKTTITTSIPGNGAADRQVIRNNYFTASAAVNEDTGGNRHSKFVSTYYNPSSTASGVTTETTTPSTFTTQDVFFRDFDHRSKFYEREPKYETSFPTTVSTTGTNYINKYKYETDSYSDAPRYSVEVVTTSEPTANITEPTQSTTDPQHYNIPSELPPISANLPGLVNALMDDHWPPKASDTAPGAGNTRGPHFRKQLHRTTSYPSAVDSYDIDPVTTTTRRPLQRQRRPHPSRTTPASPLTAETSENSGPSTRAPISRSRSRYVPNNEERPSSRGRSRSRTTTPRSPRKEEENLEYQRDVLKQNYPVIRPQGQGASTPTTTPSSTTIPTTPSTTLSNQEQFEDTSERLFSTTLVSDTVDPQQQVTRKYSTYFSDSTYEQEPTITTVLPSQTSSYSVSSYSTRSQTGDRLDEDEYLRPQEVIHLNRDPEPIHSVIPLRTHTPIMEASPQTAPPAIQYLSEKEEIEEKLTTAYGQPLEEAMELKKMAITPRPRRPGLVARQRDAQQNYALRTTTERTTTLRTTTPEPAVSGAGSRTSSGRRPAFVRRPSRLYATTTLSPTTTAEYTNEQQQQSTHGTNTVRTKNRQDILRGRTRRPTTTTEPAAPGTTISPEAPVTRAFGRGSNLRRISPTLRSRQEQTTAATVQQTSTAAPSSSGPRFRIRERTRFNLQPQESQWSSKLNQNSFQPVLKTDSRVNDIEQENVSTEPEPEIVTAARTNDVYFLNVSSNYGQKDNSKQDVNAEDSTETSVSSFADLLNDVMKDFIDENRQKKTEHDSDEKDQASTENQRRPVANFRNNILRKRGRSKVVDSFETAESQHINQAAQVYNGPPHFEESLKSIDHVGLSGKNLPHSAKHVGQREAFEEQENTAQEQATVAPAEIAAEETETEEASLEVVTGYAEVQTSTTSTPPTNSTKPMEEVHTSPSVEQTTTSLSQQQDHAEVTTETPTTVEAEVIYDDESSFLAEGEVAKKKVSDGIFADVKKTISDLYEMAEHDTETEEIVDGEEPAGIDRIEDEDFQPTEDSRSLGGSFDEQVTSTTDISPSETQFVQVTAEPPTFINPMGSLVIPTSVSNGITHETEICYRGRCIKTEDDKRKRKFKLN